MVTYLKTIKNNLLVKKSAPFSYLPLNLLFFIEKHCLQKKTFEFLRGCKSIYIYYIKYAYKAYHITLKDYRD